MEERYPRLEINLAHLKHNVTKVVEKCGDMGIQVAGVIKGATGLPEVAKAFDEGGAAFIASSRLEQLEDAKNAGIQKPLLMIRIPMLSEVEDVVRLTDISLKSRYMSKTSWIISNWSESVPMSAATVPSRQLRKCSRNWSRSRST